MNEHEWSEVLSVGPDAVHWCKWCGTTRHNHNGNVEYHVPGVLATPNSEECGSLETLDDIRVSNGKLLETLKEMIDNCGCCEDCEPCANCKRAEDAIAAARSE